MNHIIKYNIFESFAYENGCIMLELPISNWDEILSIINEEDIYDVQGGKIPFGLQKRAHLTLLYPIKKSITFDEVKPHLDAVVKDEPITVVTKNIEVFEGTNYDILVIKVEDNPYLKNIHNYLSQHIHNYNRHSFNPHITIGYIKKGTGDKYCKDLRLEISGIDTITYSHKGEDSLYKVNENKMWYKTIPEMLNFLKSKSDLPWLWLDTETTGLLGPKHEQLTQVSALATNYDFNFNSFDEIGSFDEKIKLTSEIKTRYNQPDGGNRRILSFNHYGSGGYKYKDERQIVDEFFDWMTEFSPCLLIAQNAGFDMQMLSGRYGHKINNEVLDTKMLIQLYFLPLLQKLAETNPKYKQMVDYIGTSTRDNGLISSSMSKIGPALGINMSGYHDAITDCRITIQMYQKIVDLLDQHKNVDISKYQTERIKSIRTK